MDNIFYKGRLDRWNDDKGFGFIKPDRAKQNIFIHISALKKMSRRPVTGDIIHYQVHTDNDGKKRAVCASIEGVRSISPTRIKTQKKPRTSIPFPFIFIGLAGLIAVLSFKQPTLPVAPSERKPIVNIQREVNQPNYTCQGKVYCSEMTSCEEAMFYLRHCPGTKMDGDRDGIPCENQWCSY